MTRLLKKFVILNNYTIEEHRIFVKTHHLCVTRNHTVQEIIRLETKKNRRGPKFIFIILKISARVGDKVEE